MTKRRRRGRLLSSPLGLAACCLLLLVHLRGHNATHSSPILLYTTQSDIRIANTSTPSKTVPIIDKLEQGLAVDFYCKGDLICWSDQVLEVIQCAHYDGTTAGEKIKLVSENIISPSGIAIDWFTEKLYWTDGESNRIEVTTLDGKWRKVLFWSDIDQARAIALLPMKGLMFWTDWGELPKIERAGMNGDPKTRKVIVNENIYWPNGLSIDYSTETIYWLDGKLKFIDCMDINGQKRKRIVKGGLVYPFALTLYSEKLYWTDWKTWSIHFYDISKNGSIENLPSSNPVPMDIRVYDASRQPPPTTAVPCSVHNANCSHLCLLSPDSPGYTCACPTGIKLAEGSDSRCSDAPQRLLLVAQRSTISKISLDSPDFTPYSIPVRGVKRAISVDYDYKSQYIYWADNIVKSISRVRLDGSEQTTIIQGSGGPDSIAVDNLAGNLYWTDPVTDTITVARLDGSSRKVLIHSELYEPRAIALHPTAGWMFWSDWNERRPKIERASLDGSERVLLVSDKLAWPNGIALDTATNKLYWGDARTHKIEVCNMDGTDRRQLHDNDILHIFGLTLLRDHLYWTDMQRRTLDRINKDTGSQREAIVEQLANMMGVKAIDMDSKLGWNACVDNNGNCSHLCFNRPTDLVCGCPLGLELGKDKRTCVQANAYLLYARKNIIGRISIENPGDNNDAVLPLKDVKEVSALAIHVAEGKLYWSDSKSKSINRCGVSGNNAERVLEGAGLVEGLAVDWMGRNMFWTDATAQRIEVARLDGSCRRALIWQALRKPKSIALDPRRGHMYWSELGSKSIKRAGMDGSSVTVILEQVGRANALAVDYDGRMLYWATLDPAAIEYSALDGTRRNKLITENTPMPYALTLFQDYIYWGDWTTGDIEVGKKSDGSSRRQIHGKLDYIADLSVWHKSRQPGTGRCSLHNGGCSHLCLSSGEHDARHTCACATHYTLKADNTTCSEPEEYLMFATKNTLSRMVVGGSDSPDIVLPLTGLKNVRAIDYDPVNKHVYWMDDDSHSIRRVTVRTTVTSVTEATVVVSGLTRPYHLVLDVLGRALYWSCSDLDSINVTSIDNNSSSGVIVSGTGMMPRHIALHQIKRLLVWIDVGLGGIMRANVDGSSRKELAKAPNATGLTIDQATGVVYWAVARQIHAIHLDGSNKRVIWQGGWALSLAGYGGSLYWVAGGAASGERPLMRLPLARRDAPASVVPHAARITALIAVHAVARWHPCYGGAACGGAAGACLAEGTCGCGAGCARAPPPCPPGHFTCDLSRQSITTSPAATECIPLAWKCDSQVDCPDGSDESDCGECGRGVRCIDGTCAESLSSCDSGVACEADDFPDAFRCGGGRVCLAARLLCDRTPHCEDGSDEATAACGFVSDPQAMAPAKHGDVLVIVCVLVAGGVVAVFGYTWLRRWRAGDAARRRERGPAEMSVVRQLYPHKPTDNTRLSRRERPVGASGSDSGGERYPRDPPPSPATESGGRRRAYRHYRAMNRPPPPTPCSTDACESDYTATGAAPPPTPCATSPPSPSAPSSRSSTYFSPYPPPPSPAPHFSDS